MPLIGVLLGGLAGFGLSAVQTPLYASSTQLFVSTSGSASTSDFVAGSEFSRERVASYAELITGERLATRVVDELSLDITPEQLSEAIEAEPVAETVLIDVTVTDSSALRAQEIARVVGGEFSTLVGDFESRGTAPAVPI
jgi:capsular polysaccharide biosynthesis protein